MKRHNDCQNVHQLTLPTMLDRFTIDPCLTPCSTINFATACVTRKVPWRNIIAYIFQTLPTDWLAICQIRVLIGYQATGSPKTDGFFIYPTRARKTWRHLLGPIGGGAIQIRRGHTSRTIRWKLRRASKQIKKSILGGKHEYKAAEISLYKCIGGIVQCLTKMAAENWGRWCRIGMILRLCNLVIFYILGSCHQPNNSLDREKFFSP